MVQRANKFTYVAAITAAIILFFSLMLGGGAQFASAAASSYTNVIDDLKKDESFNAADYPEVLKDYSLNVIQIAEGIDGELFVYVYQPSGQRADLKASSINISKQPNGTLNLTFDNYNLTLINSSGVFYKYKVEGFELEDTEVRYYNISNVLRPFESAIDKNPSVGTITEVENAVEQLWTVRTVDGNVEYAKTYSEVITITQKYVGYLQYFNGIDFDTGSLVNPEVSSSTTLRHFVAFSTDHQIDRLIEVELEYCLQEWRFELCANIEHSITDASHNYKDIVYALPAVDPETFEIVQPETIHDVIKGKKDSSNAHGWFGTKYTWDTIQTTADFLAEQSNQNYKLTNTEGVTSIVGTQWVLSFYTQSAEMVTRGNLATSPRHFNGEYNKVTDVILLRLMFETDGETYNLGVVDNKMTGDNKPINSPTGIGSGCSGAFSGCSGCNSSLPWWAWVLIFTLGPLAIILLYVTAYLIISSIFKRNRERKPKSAKNKHSKGATGKRKHKTTKKRGNKK